MDATTLTSAHVLSWSHCGDKLSRLYAWPQGEGVRLLRRPHSDEHPNAAATAYVPSKNVWADCLQALPKAEADRLMKQCTAHRERPTDCGLNLAPFPLQGCMVMGIVNVTPDSFHDGGQHTSTTDALAYGARLVAEGAQILDVGGESTRPGAEPPSLDEELERTLPVIQGILQQGTKDQKNRNFVISIDTRRAAVMDAAVQAGAQIINDVSALEDDPASLAVATRLAREYGTVICLMHKQGQPQTMQDNPNYTVASLDVYDHLEARLQTCLNAGIPRDKIWLDPGIGFGKTLAHNLDILSHLGLYHGLGCPLLVGLSRKGFVSHIMERCGTSIPTSQDRLSGSLAGAIHSIAHGVQIVRVHDVAETVQALAVTEAIPKVMRT